MQAWPGQSCFLLCSACGCGIGQTSQVARLILATLDQFDVGLQDPDLHVKNLKTSHEASPLVNHCIECGFCESACPSRDVTLTPRQRITTLREIHRLREIPDKSTAQLARCAL